MDKQEYRSESARQHVGNGANESGSIEFLEKKVLSNNDADTNSMYRQAISDLKRVGREMRELEDFDTSYIGKVKQFIYYLIPPKIIISVRTAKLERHKSELGTICAKNRENAERISEKIADSAEAKSYAGILLEKYDIMIEELRNKREELRNDYNNTRINSIANTSDSSYKETEKELRAVDTDLRNIKFKQAKAAQKVVFHDRTEKTYEGLLAIVNKILTESEKALLRADLRVGEARTLRDTSVSPTKDVVEVIAGSEEAGSSLEKFVDRYKTKTFEAAKILQDLPKLGTNGKAENSIEKQFMDSVEIECDSYIEEAKKILERDRK